MTPPALQPLSGRRIAVTRTREQAGELARQLAAFGATVIELPLIQVTREVDPETRDDVFAGLGSYDWLVFTSANGVRYFFEEFFAKFDDLRSLGLLRIACVGPATARAVRALRLGVELCPEQAEAGALAEALAATGSLDSAKILVVTGNRNREVLVKKLAEARAIVDELAVYRTEKTDLAANAAAQDFRRHGADAVLFASSSAVQSFVAQAGALQLSAAARRPLTGSIGPQTSAALRQCGLAADFEAAVPGFDGLVEALVKKLAGR